MATSASDSIRNCFVVITTITHTHTGTGLGMADPEWLMLQFWERREKMRPENKQHMFKYDSGCERTERMSSLQSREIR